MKTLSTWLALAGLFFMSAGHSVAAECPPHMPSIEAVKANFAKVAEEREAQHFVAIKDGETDGIQVLFLLVKEGDKFAASASVFQNGCRLPVRPIALDPVTVAVKAFGSTLAAIFARET